MVRPKYWIHFVSHIMLLLVTAGRLHNVIREVARISLLMLMVVRQTVRHGRRIRWWCRGWHSRTVRRANVQVWWHHFSLDGLMHSTRCIRIGRISHRLGFAHLACFLDEPRDAWHRRVLGRYAQRVLDLQPLRLVASVLEPDFHLRRRQVQCLRNDFAFRCGQVALLAEAAFQFEHLRLREEDARFALGAHLAGSGFGARWRRLDGAGWWGDDLMVVVWLMVYGSGRCCCCGVMAGNWKIISRYLIILYNVQCWFKCPCHKTNIPLQ